MKKVLSSLLFTIFTVFPPAVFAQEPEKKPEPQAESKAAKQIKTKYDKSRNLTTVSLKSMDLGGAMTKEVTAEGQIAQLTLDAFFTYPGEQKTKTVESLTMRFTTRAKYTVFQRGQNLMAVLNDATAIPLGDTGYRTNPQTFYTDEILEAVLPYEAMKRMSEAKTMKLYLGNREIKFRSEQLDVLRELTARMAN